MVRSAMMTARWLTLCVDATVARRQAVREALRLVRRLRANGIEITKAMRDRLPVILDDDYNAVVHGGGDPIERYFEAGDADIIELIRKQKFVDALNDPAQFAEMVERGRRSISAMREHVAAKRAARAVKLTRRKRSK